jgi:hypothetical protein
MRFVFFVTIFLSLCAYSHQAFSIDRAQRLEYIMDKASEHIENNTKLFVELASEVDGVSGLAWGIILGQKLTSQPLGVINVLSMIKNDAIKQVCSPTFVEGTEDYEINDWLDTSIRVLGSFTMKEKSKENIRINCLNLIIDAKKSFQSHIYKNNK